MSLLPSLCSSSLTLHPFLLVLWFSPKCLLLNRFAHLLHSRSTWSYCWAQYDWSKKCPEYKPRGNLWKLLLQWTGFLAVYYLWILWIFSHYSSVAFCKSGFKYRVTFPLLPFRTILRFFSIFFVTNQSWTSLCHPLFRVISGQFISGLFILLGPSKDNTSGAFSPYIVLTLNHIP